MKNKIIVFIICLIITIIGIFLINKKELVYKITLDINPSIEISINRNLKVIDIKPLNNDAKDIISDDLNGKKLEDAINILSNNIISNGYIKNDEVTILMYVEGSINKDDIKDKVINSFVNKNILTRLINIENVSSDDKKLANLYNISISKASYINSIKEEIDISVDDLINKPISELEKVKDSKHYCDKDYTLIGAECYKKTYETEPIMGLVCPNNYYEYNGICYKKGDVIVTDKDICDNDFTLVNNRCVRKIIKEKEGICENSYDFNSHMCIENVYIGDAYEYCRDSGRTLYEHKCLATKPTINGGCLGSDKLLNGKCVNMKNDYYMAEWMCPNGKTNSNQDGSLMFEDNKCYDEKKIEPKSYGCSEGYTLIDDKCVMEEVFLPMKEHLCKKGYSLIDNDICINFDETIDKEKGLVCNIENSRLEDNKCIIYDIKESKHNL